MSAATQFGLLRHGETVWNREKRLQGRLDSPLTDDGIEAVRTWARFLGSRPWRWSRIVTSPAERARQTAMIINERLALDVQENAALREQDWGIWEGMTDTEVVTTYREILDEQIQGGWSFRPPEGESRSEVCLRVRTALSRLGEKYPGEQILVITHQGVIKALVYFIEKRQFLPDEPKILEKNSLQIISHRHEGFAAMAYNITT